MKAICVEVEPVFGRSGFTLYRVYDVKLLNYDLDPPIRLYTIIDDNGDEWEVERYSYGEYSLCPEYDVWFIEVPDESDVR